MNPATTTAIELDTLVPAWRGLRKSLPFFGPIRSERDYSRMHALMVDLLGQVGDDENHPLADFLEVVATLIARYEETAHQSSFEQTKPSEVLKLLMAQHGLKQADLRREVGTQGVVSEILAGERFINARQAKALGKRFGVSPAVFL